MPCCCESSTVAISPTSQPSSHAQSVRCDPIFLWQNNFLESHAIHVTLIPLYPSPFHYLMSSWTIWNTVFCKSSSWIGCISVQGQQTAQGKNRGWSPLIDLLPWVVQTDLQTGEQRFQHYCVFIRVSVAKDTRQTIQINQCSPVPVFPWNLYEYILASTSSWRVYFSVLHLHIHEIMQIQNSVNTSSFHDQSMVFCFQWHFNFLFFTHARTEYHYP